MDVSTAIQQRPNRALTVLTSGVLLVVAIVVAGLFFINYRFKTPGNFVGILEGRPLIIDSNEKFVTFTDKHSIEHVEFTLTNIGFSSASILGASLSCDCMSTTKLPITIKPNESRTLSIAVHSDSITDSAVSALVVAELHTNLRTQRRFILKIHKEFKADSNDAK